MQSRNLAWAVRSWVKEVVRCWSSWVSWFLMAVSWGMGRVERLTASVYQYDLSLEVFGEIRGCGRTGLGLRLGWGVFGGHVG